MSTRYDVAITTFAGGWSARVRGPGLVYVTQMRSGLLHVLWDVYWSIRKHKA